MMCSDLHMKQENDFQIFGGGGEWRKGEGLMYVQTGSLLFLPRVVEFEYLCQYIIPTSRIV